MNILETKDLTKEFDALLAVDNLSFSVEGGRKGIIASIIGGIGNVPGAMFGGFFLGIAENLGIWKIQAGWKDCIAFLILIVFLLLRPGGILGIKPAKETV